MNFDIFQDASHVFSLVLFVQPDDFDGKRGQIEKLGNQKNIQMVVQPCPYEGIEFLYRVSEGLIGHHTSIDKEVFWQAIELRGDVTEQIRKQISKHHHNYLVSILEQDAKKVEAEGKVLESLSEYYIS